MSTINLSVHWHYNEHTARDCVARTAAGENRDGSTEITASCALTIASWWQSPGTVGRTLAAFASGATVDRTELLDDIRATRNAHGYFGPSGEPFTRGDMSEDDRLALDMLSTFVLHYGEDEA